MGAERSNHFAWVCAATTFIGALLLFLVQPVISKIILPWFGGTPAVWTTCMLFFQTALLAGYAYAHLLVRAFDVSWQIRIHGFVTLAAAFTLPITPGVPQGDVEASPVRSILWILSMNVGMPFFALSATGPLLQSWFGGVYPGKPPYRLYALSNVGSLAALWLFPIGLEPRLNSMQQDVLWSTGFGVYLVLLFVMSLVYERIPFDEDDIIYPARSIYHGGAAPRDLAVWIGLPALASVLLCAITSHICQDVAVVPFLLILPLSLYLLAFILAFDSPRWYVRGVWSILAIASLIGVAVTMLGEKLQEQLVRFAPDWQLNSSFVLTEYTDRADVETFVYLAAMFSVTMILIGETTRRKPQPGQLTLYYLAIAGGGALGSAVVAIICPLVFNLYYELYFALFAGFVAAGAVLITATASLFQNELRRFVACGLASLPLAAGLSLMVAGLVTVSKEKVDFMTRNFYGTASVKTEVTEEGVPVGRVLYNGRINHGYQFLDGPRRYQTNSYYQHGSGVDLARQALRARQQPLKVGVIGLGTGTLAAFGKQGDEFQFYEIDRKIEEIARERFTYLSDSPADVQVHLGDARVVLQRQLEREGSQQFDLLVVDAFSSDAIPVHLLTLEALQLYNQHVRPDGILAIHVSNRHLYLDRVAGRLAQQMKAKALLVEFSDWGPYNYNAASDWVLITVDPQVLAFPALQETAAHVPGQVHANPAITRIEALHGDAPLWTDSFSNVWQVMEPWRQEERAEVDEDEPFLDE